MQEEKFKRVVVASVVTAVLLFIILLATMIFQMSSIAHHKQMINELDAKIAEYNQMIEETGDTIQTRSMRWWIERRARELGYHYEDDFIFDLNGNG